MKKRVSVFIPVCSLLLIQLCSYSQTPAVKKFHLLPVYLVYSGLPVDTSLERIVKEAFSRHKVEVITKSKFDLINEAEVSRVAAKFRVRNDQFKSERDTRDAISAEQHFVTNLLTIHFSTQYSTDSVFVTRASWEATPFPPDINSSRTSGKIETLLTDTCCSVQDNVFSIVDKILLSKWLR